jgi:hypothetical protein
MGEIESLGVQAEQILQEYGINVFTSSDQVKTKVETELPEKADEENDKDDDKKDISIPPTEE